MNEKHHLLKLDRETKCKPNSPHIANPIHFADSPKNQETWAVHEVESNLHEILVVTSYPPRVCGIATFSEDLIGAISNKFRNSLSLKVCARESGDESFTYPSKVIYTLKTSNSADYKKLAEAINRNKNIQIVLIQHEFGFFRKQEQAFLQLIYNISKPVVVAFHTILPHPDEHLSIKIQNISIACDAIIVMTNSSSNILITEYGKPKNKISVIAHGTHLVPHLSQTVLKIKYGLKNRMVLTTFGLLSSGKSIETTLDALPAIVEKCPEVIFLVIGKTHPEVVKDEGEKYRESLEKKVAEYGLQNNVKFINKYLPLPELLEYLQLTDIYLFTTNDPNQAVSGTFAYAMSCACPIISTPIPHAREVLTKDTGIIFDFRNSQQLSQSVIHLINDRPLRKHLSVNALQKIVATAWENSAIAHAMLFERLSSGTILLEYNLPPVNLSHLNEMTTDTGIIQFSKINQPNIETGYTLDDNARAMVASCMHFKLTGDTESLNSIRTYLYFIKHCLQPSGNFFNYVDKDRLFTAQNNTVNLDDSNGRAIRAIGFLISLKKYCPKKLCRKPEPS